MSWYEEWKDICSLVDNLRDLHRSYGQYCDVRGSDYHGIANKFFIPEAKAINSKIIAFIDRHAASIPEDMRASLKKSSSDFVVDSGITGAGYVTLQLGLAVASASRLVSDGLPRVRNLAERAFILIARSIEAIDLERKAWKTAFAAGETDCEKLGSIALLRQGIWSFKTDAAGAKTDLVLGKALSLDGTSLTAMEGLILTEWKRVTKPQTAKEVMEAAAVQAARYSQGILAGYELAEPRYLVMVSKTKLVDLPSDYVWKDTKYRIINIAVDPDVPSKSKAPSPQPAAVNKPTT